MIQSRILEGVPCFGVFIKCNIVSDKMVMKGSGNILTHLIIDRSCMHSEDKTQDKEGNAQVHIIGIQ